MRPKTRVVAAAASPSLVAKASTPASVPTRREWSRDRGELRRRELTVETSSDGDQRNNPSCAGAIHPLFLEIGVTFERALVA